ncbi:MGH1-like glycoside hydrolase domain-containing protein [Paracnuella aquatica]|uniref:MGH1-like glycoside hydrolase domain-containing protein n=1 Tax=Paracnuella aquatica TaxID=2268757 RepID=UPI001F4D59AB|nr:glucosidase [Paracnuella aquatica]
MTAEHQRLAANATKLVPLEQWGPYLSERQWGTVREDYGPYGDAWNYFPFDHAHCRAYKWGEDGLAGISDVQQNICFAVALWNGKDPILKERLFGLKNGEGNHGEDVKELYYYLDNLPTHYYMEYLYKYPQQAFPYDLLRSENRKRTRQDVEYEILDTGVFNNNQYFDVLVTYAKRNSTDIFIKIDVTNRYTKSADITVLPTLWFYNRYSNQRLETQPLISAVDRTSVVAEHGRLGTYHFYFQPPTDALFTNNVTNKEIVQGLPNDDIFVKDAFHQAIINGANVSDLRRKGSGTKFSPVYKLKVGGGETKTIYCRLSSEEHSQPFAPGFEYLFTMRKEEADEYYAAIMPKGMSRDMADIQRQAIAGLLWSKQYYHYDVERWLSTSDGISAVNPGKQNGRNHEWSHLKNQDVILMPDKWEYPWYAAWDLAFQCISMAAADPTFAKHQLLLLMREWYMKPDGQLPAYEWNFGDVNPPVHAWAAMQVYEIEKKQKGGTGDIQFLKKAFQKLLINFTWWTNRKDKNGNNIFEGGFLGLDNIGVFNRSYHFINEVQLEQADGTSWMGTYALDMMDMALEIAVHDPSFEDTATKFFEHFVLIAEALNEHHLWNEEDKFYYDVLVRTGNDPLPLRIKSIVGLTPLFAVSKLDHRKLEKLRDFNKRYKWFEKYRKRNGKFWPNEQKDDGTTLLSLVPKDKLVHLLQRLVDEAEFLSPGGIRALSKYHEEHPYSVTLDGNYYTIRYDPGDSTSDIFGGNSNWRGPVWMPINYLIIQSIRSYGEFYGDTLLLEFPTRSGRKLNLCQIADELTARVISLFQKDSKGARRYNAEYNWFYQQPGNEHLMLFYEYFNGDSGRGLGAAHQTGWTALVAELISELGNKPEGCAPFLQNESTATVPTGQVS